MGNQGMTNWKFTAFLAITLMLVAGLFSSTAMAAANDGHGTMSVTVAQGDATGVFQAAADPLPQILFANEAGYTVTFTYTATADMNGGMVRVAIPGDDWKFPKANVTVTITGDSEALTAAENTGDRLVFTGPDDALTSIAVKLDADWTDGDALTIVTTGVTSAIPRSLHVPREGLPYREYTFRTTSMASGGVLRSLLIPDTGDNAGEDPQPKIRVGNVASGRGTIKVSPIVYQSETDRNIQLTFTAAGPMYDSGDINSNVTITIPAGLGTAADPFPAAPNPQTTTANGDEFVSVSRVTGDVGFANPNQRIIVDTTTNTILIDITRMQYNATVTVSYRKVDVNPTLSANADFSATSISGATATGPVTFDPAVGTGHVRTIAGSGEIKITPEIVAIDSRRNLTFTYKAHTALTNADLVIAQPDDTPWSDLTLVMGSANARADNYVTVSGGGDVALAITTDNDISLTGLDLAKNGSFSVTINRAVLSSTSDADPPVTTVTPAGAYEWATSLVPEGGTGGDLATDPTLYIVNVNDDVAFDIVNADGATVNDLPHYPAASERNIYFQFEISTPIKGGGLRFNIPNGWRGPSHTDVAGRARVKLLERGADGTTLVDTDTADAIPANLVDKYGADDNVVITASGSQISVAIKTLNGTATTPARVTVVYGNGTGDMRGMVQRNAQADLEIIGRFSTGVSGTYYPADSPVIMRIGNVEAGSGTASITSPASHTVEAGSDDNTIRIVYRAAGTMNGGSVRLGTPPTWGDLQETDSAVNNYIQVMASSSVANQDDIRYGTHNVLVPLTTAGNGSTVTFVLSNVKAQTQIGIAEFTVESAGGPSDSLTLLLGEVRPADDENADNKEDDPYRLLGRVYDTNMADDTDTPTVDESRDGLIRLEVVPGAGGTGEAELVEIVRTDSGLQNYLDEEGEVIADRRVHAGDEEIYLVFRYTPVETIDDGALRFTVPSDWSPPQEESSNVLGYTEISTSGSLGAYDFENRSIEIPIVSINSGQNLEIHYGVGSLGAKAPTAKKTSEFLFAVKGSAGTFTNIGAVEVDVHSQASGRGSASIAATNATAGHPDGSIVITYDPIGQIANGRIKLTVDEKLTGGADAAGVTASHISVSTGSAKYGGSVDHDLEANDDVTKDDVLVSGVNLSASSTFTFTYEGMMPEAAGDLSFTVAVDGGEGPGEVAEGMPTPMALIDGSGALSVTVGDAAAGSGTVMVTQDPGAVVAGSSGNTITVTYTAIGSIGEGKTITVAVPYGWSAPLNEAAADEKLGTFTVTHLLKLTADDTDGVRDDGGAVAPSTMKAAGAAADAMPMIMVGTVAAAGLAAGDSVVFAYTNADAPADTGSSYFTTEYDGEQVGENADVKVIVQSAEGATAVTLEADDFNIDDGGSTTVTIKLVASDGSPATGSADTVVTLTADGGTIASSVTIAAGDYHAETELSATASANITVTASATGLEGAEIMVHADTDNVMIDSVSVAPSVAAAGTTVAVSAMGSAAQDGSFSVGDIVTDSALTEDEAGSYTGSFMVVADLHADGDYTVTVSLNGASDASASVTIDSTAPEVSATGPTDPVSNGDTVTITVTATDAGSGLNTVMADVSALDTTQGMVDASSGTAEITISADNEAANGAHDVVVTATDMAGNSASATVSVTLNNEITYTSTLPAGISLFSVPLDVEGLDTVGDLAAMLEGENLLITYDGTTWNSRSDDVAIAGDLGILVSMSAEESVTFTGYAWGDGAATVSLSAGSNLVGLPVNDPDVANISDIAGLFGEGVVTGVIVSSGGEFKLVAAAGDDGDGPVAGDAAYLVMASAAGSADLMGDGWSTDAAGAAPIALTGYTVDNQTPVLDVLGSVVDEITGLTKEGFRVKVKNLSTKAALSHITSAEVSDGYNMTFVDLSDSHAARVGDVLEISADSPDPLIGVQPVRHIVTVDDVKNSRIELEALIAYEIPAETELLRNYPNPFNPETWIPYHLAEDAKVSLTIYDVNGELVRTIDIGHQTAAKYDTRSKAIYWDGRNLFGEQVASGIYFYSLSAGDFSATRKMVILK